MSFELAVSHKRQTNTQIMWLGSSLVVGFGVLNSDYFRWRIFRKSNEEARIRHHAGPPARPVWREDGRTSVPASSVR